MHHRHCEQGACGLQIEARPFDEIDFREADDDALPPRVQHGLDRADDLVLRGLLASR
jgi:hypothetical protein